jgi:RNA polymerase sigma factor (sigma-70 family)
MDKEYHDDPILKGHLLALAAGKDNQKIADALKAIEHSMVGSIVSHACARHSRQLEYPDALQDVWVKLLSAAKTYDPSRPAAPFIATIARRSLSTQVTLQGAHRRRVNTEALRECDTEQRAGNQSTSSDVTFTTFLADHRQPWPDERAAIKELADRAHASLRDVLSPLELDAFLANVAGDTLQEIADREGVPLKSADNAVERARKKLSLLFRPDDANGIKRPRLPKEVAQRAGTVRTTFKWASHDAVDGFRGRKATTTRPKSRKARADAARAKEIESTGEDSADQTQNKKKAA